MVLLCLLVSFGCYMCGFTEFTVDHMSHCTIRNGITLTPHVIPRLVKLAAQVQILHQDLQMLVALDSQKHP